MIVAPRTGWIEAHGKRDADRNPSLSIKGTGAMAAYARGEFEQQRRQLMGQWSQMS